MNASAAPKYRLLAFGVTRGVLRESVSGARYLSAEAPLVVGVDRMTDRWCTGPKSRPTAPSSRAANATPMAAPASGTT